MKKNWVFTGIIARRDGRDDFWTNGTTRQHAVELSQRKISPEYWQRIDF